MDNSEGKEHRRGDDSKNNENEAEQQIFNFGSLKIDDAVNTEEFCSTSNAEDPQDDEDPPSDEEQLLPSQITDKQYIHLKETDMKEEDFMKEGGKWMIFTRGDMKKLDTFWTALKPLYQNGTLNSLKASTAYGSSEGGVINCYTTDAENWVEVKKAADAIRDKVDYRFIMYYKTNEASVQGQYIDKGYRLISRYMFTVKRGFYGKDKYNRWEKI